MTDICVIVLLWLCFTQEMDQELEGLWATSSFELRIGLAWPDWEVEGKGVERESLLTG